MPKHFQKETENTSDLLQKIARELYQKNLEIRKEQTRLDELLSSVAEVIFAINENQEITLFNSIAQAIFESSKEKSIGANVDRIIKIYDYNKDFLIPASEYSFKRRLYNIPKVKVKLSGGIERTFSLKSTFVDYDGINREAIISMADITREVEIEKLKDDFISIASHELKTPISIMKNNIWMLKNTIDRDFSEREKRYLDSVDIGVERLKNLVDDLLNVSRIDQNRLSLDIKETDLDSLIELSLNSFSETIELKKITIKKILQKGIKVKADPDKLRQVLDNLVSNAIKYSRQSNPTIEIASKIDGFNAFISISDNGQGIKEEDYTKIFTKFGRASEGIKLSTPGSSTGLGLYITKGYVENMHGSIGFKSNTNKNGTTFWFTLPTSATSVCSIL